MTYQTITIYASPWCGDCYRVRRLLNKHHVPYNWIDIDHDHQAEQFVLKHNRGMRSVPTILFEDGSTLVEPSNNELLKKLGISHG